MTTTDAAAARSYSAQAAAYTRRARRDAEMAAEFYGRAATWTRHARWLTRAGFVDGGSPADAEANARSWVKCADVMLRASTGATLTAATFRRLAASYRAMAASRAERVAAEPEVSGRVMDESEVTEMRIKTVLRQAGFRPA